MSTSRITILDCGASRTALGVFNPIGGRLECVHAAVEPFPARTPGEDRWLEHTAAALLSLNAGGEWSGPVLLVLPAHLTLIKQLKIPRVAPAQQEKIIRFEAEQAIPYALAGVVWDRVISGERDAEHEVMLAAVKRDIIERLCVAAQAAGFSPGRIIPSALATLAGFRLSQPRPASPALVLNLGARSTTLLQVEGQRFVARTLALGSGASTAEPGSEGMATLVTRLAQEINRSVMHFGQQGGLANPEHVFLTGGGARLAGLSEALATKLKLPVDLFDALGAVEFTSGTVRDLTSTDLIGAATLALAPSQPTLNLLPPSLRRRENQRRRQPWLIAAAVLAVAVLVPPILHFRQVTATARAKIAALEEAMAPLRAREARNRENLASLEQLKSQAARLQSVHDRRAGWLQLFTGLQERLVKVEDVWLEKLQTIPPVAGAPLKLVVSGRMLDKTNPLAKVSPETFTRVKDLLAGIVDLPAVSAVEAERFDNSQPGILKFDFILVIDPAHPL